MFRPGDVVIRKIDAPFSVGWDIKVKQGFSSLVVRRFIVDEKKFLAEGDPTHWIADYFELKTPFKFDLAKYL